MPRNITVTFEDGTTHVYKNAPDDVTPESVTARASSEFGKKVSALDGGKQASQSVQAKPFGQKAVEFVQPTVEALGAVGGGALGLASPLPGGTVLGAGLGYGAARTGMNFIKERLGYQRPPENALAALSRGAEDVLTGASYEAGGQIIGPVIQKIAAKGGGKVLDFVSRSRAQDRAGVIAKEAAGNDLQAIKNALQNADESLTAAQATANINSPTWQALAQRASIRDPRFFGSGPLTPSQEAQAANALSRIAGGETQAAMKTARGNALARLTDEQIPILEQELAAANIAGRLKPRLDGEAQRMAGAATSKVDDVRRFTAAGERAGARAAATTTVPGYPRAPGRYTYMGELEKRAEQVAASSADASLLFGEAARFAKSGAESLEAYGLKPLLAKDVQAGIAKLAVNPKDAGNDILRRSLRQLSDDIAQWTNKDGVLSADALYALRKNSVNTVIQDAMKGADAKAINAATADVMGKVKPLIDDAIEKAGGTGYKQYLADYAAGRQAIDQQKLGAKAAELFRTNKQQFVDLVEGNRVEDVQKIFGWGKDQYDLAKQMSAEAMATLKGTAELTKRGIVAGEQAALGQTALREILETHNPRAFKIPWGLSPKAMAINKALDIAERNIGKNTMKALTDGMRSGKSAMQVLDAMPASERSRVLSALRQAEVLPGGYAATVNALTLQD